MGVPHLTAQIVCQFLGIIHFWCDDTEIAQTLSQGAYITYDYIFFCAGRQYLIIVEKDCLQPHLMEGQVRLEEIIIVGKIILIGLNLRLHHTPPSVAG